MPSHNPVESLQNLCFDCLCHVIVTVAREQDSRSVHKYYDTRSRSAKHAHLLKRVDVWLKGMPVTLIDQLIPKMLHHIATRVSRYERLVGLQQILQLLLQPQTSKLDLTSLFHMQRMSSQINTQIENLVTSRVSAMPHLTELHLPAKCTDAVLRAAAAVCPRLQVLRLRLSYVTDEGVVYLVTRCSHLTVLDVQEVPTVTSVGVLSALQHCPTLQQLHANNLLHILMAAFQGTSRTFLFTHLAHCSDNNSYPSGGLQWLLESFPVLEGVQLCMSYSDLHALRHLPRTAHTLDLEITEDYQEPPWSTFGSSITTLVLNCNCISAAQLSTIGRHCPQLQQLQLTTEAITDGHTLWDSANTPLSRRAREGGGAGPGAGLFKCLAHLALQVYGEDLHVAVFEWFLLQCPLLEVVWVSGVMVFLTDAYMDALLHSPTLVNVRKLHLSSDEPMNLTVSSIRRVLCSLPALRHLSSVQSWQVEEWEYKEWRQHCTDHNLDLQIT